VTLTFTPTFRDAVTRAATAGNYFSKLNIQMFDAAGEKVFDKVKTQTKDEDGFGTFSLKIKPGTYWIVAVGHSSKNSATIKSPEAVQFTASDGEKLTDTFCHCSQIVVSGDAQQYDLDMYRAGAMIQFCLKDTEFPANFSHFLMEFTGGSANFNPTTMEGVTKSSQSEKRTTNGIQIYQAFTFPYMAASCNIKMTCSGLDSDGTVIRRRVFDAIPVTRNRITTYTGPFFEEGDGVFTQSDFSFLIHADWDGEDKYDF
jgi:putative component of membrane protein insertase Oxa1/YidC/SpoIIIJ protein YidD